MEEGKRWITWKNRRILVNDNGNIINNSYKKYQNNNEILKDFYDYYEKVFNNMDSETKEAFKKYAYTDFADMNKLNLGINIDNNATKSYQEKLKNYMNKMDKEINKHTFKENITLYRGTNYDYFKNYKVGDEIEISTYLSTSLNEKIANEFKQKGRNSNNPIMVEIQCPKGSNGIYMGDYVQSYNEQEVILPRNQKYKYISKENNKIILRIINKR